MAALSLSYIAKAMNGEIRGDQVVCPGPGHSPKDRSLSIKIEPGAPGGLVVFSHAQDDNLKCKDWVLKQLGLEPLRPKRAANANRKIVATYDYTDADGKLLYQVVRFDPKDFVHRQPGEIGGWIYKGSERRVLYRLPDLLKYPDGTVFVCEGEKDADRVGSLGYCATTVASGKWTEDCVNALRGRNVLILEDNDDAGRKKALDAATALQGAAKDIRIVQLPGLAHGGDVSDWLNGTGNTKEELERISFETPTWQHTDISRPVVQSSAEFTRHYIPPDYLIDGLLQRRYCYSLTAKTGSGKTAITLALATHVALGRPIGDREVEKGRVLMFAGENADDVCARWIALGHYMDFDVENIDVHFVPGRFKITELIVKIRTEMEALGGCALLIIDTSAAYFDGDDENDNVQLGQHASNMRELRIPGGPCTLINCHPPKNASDDNLLPRGGGAFLAEVDGNQTAVKNAMTVKVHWQGKFRGPEFEPINFLLKSVTTDRLRDSKGRAIWTVFAKFLSDEAEEQMASSVRRDENALLTNLIDHGPASISVLAKRMGWLTKSGGPQKSKVHAVLERLKKAKLVRSDRDVLEVTHQGKKAASQEPNDPNGGTNGEDTSF
jgi:hypothetical protein